MTQADKLRYLANCLEAVQPIISDPASFGEYYTIANRLRIIAEEIDSLADRYWERLGVNTEEGEQ